MEPAAAGLTEPYERVLAGFKKDFRRPAMPQYLRFADISFMRCPQLKKCSDRNAEIGQKRPFYDNAYSFDPTIASNMERALSFPTN